MGVRDGQQVGVQDALEVMPFPAAAVGDRVVYRPAQIEQAFGRGEVVQPSFELRLRDAAEIEVVFRLVAAAFGRHPLLLGAEALRVCLAPTCQGVQPCRGDAANAADGRQDDRHG